MAGLPDPPYEKLLELGRGGMGTALLARLTGTGGFERLVVVKRLHQRLLHEPEIRRRFIDEARLAASVHHANVVGIQQASTDDDGPFLVLDYVEGASLDALIEGAAARGDGLPVPIALRIALDALTGLHAVHEARDGAGRPLRILHRDISPQNILVGLDGVARVADFGIAKSTLAPKTTEVGMVMGKLAYMAPEYLAREPSDRRMDIYSMGITLWETLAGAAPWPQVTDAQLVAHIFSTGVPELSTVMDIAPQVEAVVARACSRTAEDRYATARDMVADVAAIGRETGWVASHGEVAEFVHALVGSEIQDRRSSVAQVLGASRQAVADQPTTQRRADARPASRPVSVTASRIGQRRFPWGAVGAGVALAAVVAGVLGVALSGAEPAAEASGLAAPRPEHETATRAAGESPPRPAVRAGSREAPASDPTPESSHSTSASSPEPRSEPGATPKRTAPRPKATPPKPATAPPSAAAPADPGLPVRRRQPRPSDRSDGITKVNPYR
jgi:serine/threonine-protein kinase